MTRPSTAGAVPVVGTATGGVVARADEGTDDFTSGAQPLVALTSRLSPAGPAGECLFTAVVVTLTYAGGAAGPSVTVTPIVDGYEQLPTTFALPPSAGRTTVRREAPVLQRLMTGATELARFHVRGASIQARVETVPGSGRPGELIVDGVSVEFDVLRAAVPRA